MCIFLSVRLFDNLEEKLKYCFLWKLRKFPMFFVLKIHMINAYILDNKCVSIYFSSGILLQIAKTIKKKKVKS